MSVTYMKCAVYLSLKEWGFSVIRGGGDEKLKLPGSRGVGGGECGERDSELELKYPVAPWFLLTCHFINTAHVSKLGNTKTLL